MQLRVIASPHRPEIGFPVVPRYPTLVVNYTVARHRFDTEPCDRRQSVNTNRLLAFLTFTVSELAPPRLISLSVCPKRHDSLPAVKRNERPVKPCLAAHVNLLLPSDFINQRGSGALLNILPIKLFETISGSLP
jgi:hypothetical protein